MHASLLEPDPLSHLTTLATNLPVHIPALLDLTSTPGLPLTRKSLRATELSLLSANLPSFFTPQPTCLLYINNVPYPLQEDGAGFNVHHLLNAIATLSRPPPAPPTVSKARAADLESLLKYPRPPPPEIRLDISPHTNAGKALHFLNSITKSPAYATYPLPLTAYKTYHPTSQIPAIKADLYTTITPLDLAALQAKTLQAILTLLQSGLPVRIAVAPYAQTDLRVFQSVTPDQFTAHLRNQSTIATSAFHIYTSFATITTSPTVTDLAVAMGTTSSHLALQYLLNLSLDTKMGSEAGMEPDDVVAAIIGEDLVTEIKNANVTAVMRKYTSILSLINATNLDPAHSIMNGRLFPNDAPTPTVQTGGYIANLLSTLSQDALIVQSAVLAGLWTHRKKGSWYKTFVHHPTAVTVTTVITPTGHVEYGSVTSSVYRSMYATASQRGHGSILLSVTSCLDITLAVNALAVASDVTVFYSGDYGEWTCGYGKVVINGVVFESAGEELTVDDLTNMVKYAKKVTAQLPTNADPGETALSVLYVNEFHEGNRDGSLAEVRELVGREHWMEFDSNPASNADVTVVVEPLSFKAMRMLPIVVYLRDVLEVRPAGQAAITLRKESYHIYHRRSSNTPFVRPGQFVGSLRHSEQGGVHVRLKQHARVEFLPRRSEQRRGVV